MSNDDIEKLFIDMKNRSELMVDLAYSALLYDNKVIAKEVFMMEETVDGMNSEIQKKAVSNAINDKNVDKSLVMIRLASCIENIADAAMHIADVVLRDIEPHPIFRISLRESDVIITRAKVGERSILAGKTLGETKVTSECGLWVIALKRNGQWIYGPDEDTRIESGDILFARGPLEGEKTFIGVAEGKRKRW